MTGQGNSDSGSRPGSSAPASDAARGPDLARLAHELRTPLGAISVLAEILRDEKLGPLGSARYRGYAADLHQSAANANAVLQAFLDPSPAGETTGGPMEFAEIELGELIGGIVSALTPMAQKSGVSLGMRPGVLPHVIADRRSIRQMLNNLIANAMKFTPPGGRVEVRASYVPGGPVVLEVADTGDGMSETELVRARTGQRAPDAVRRRTGGSGIGLPMVRVLAAANGASFDIASSLGEGTTARLTFPHDRVVPV